MNKIYKQYMDKLRKEGKISVLDYGYELVREFNINIIEARKIVLSYINNR